MSLYDHTIVAPVLESNELQWRSLRRSFRTSVNKSRRQQLSLIDSRSKESFLEFSRHFNEFASQRNLAPLSADVVSSIFDRYAQLDPPAVLLVQAKRSEAILGGILLVRNRDRLIYEWGWTAPHDVTQGTPVMHPLFWRAFEIARERDINSIDLGGYWSELGHEDPINHFKLGISKSVVRILPEHVYVMSPLLYGFRSHLRKLSSFVRQK
ncbi:MAG: GNAT family N-acetyltransferase [Woeseiaceae bacterium]|nr:GNAT family N-acetyltransferase [Woeseiaceae bacterium]